MVMKHPINSKMVIESNQHSGIVLNDMPHTQHKQSNRIVAPFAPKTILFRQSKVLHESAVS